MVSGARRIYPFSSRDYFVTVTILLISVLTVICSRRHTMSYSPSAPSLRVASRAALMLDAVNMHENLPGASSLSTRNFDLARGFFGWTGGWFRSAGVVRLAGIVLLLAGWPAVFAQFPLRDSRWQE